MYDRDLDAVRAPLYGIGGLLGLTVMALLFIGFAEVRWFALFSLPLGILVAVGLRYWQYWENRQLHKLIWTRNVRPFHWPHPIS